MKDLRRIRQVLNIYYNSPSWNFKLLNIYNSGFKGAKYMVLGLALFVARKGPTPVNKKLKTEKKIFWF